MAKQNISAFTYKADGRANVLLSDVKVSAHKELVPDATLKNFKAIWDTGATNTAISERVVKECNLVPISKATSNTANGQRIVNVYLIDLYLPNNVVIGGVRATEFTAVEGSDLLIGMDVIGMGDLAISNYMGKTCFSFRVPSIACTDYVQQINSLKQVTSVKIGRNDPCPCGSGRKYKQCCGKNT